MESSSSKWRRERPESCDDSSKVGELKKPISLGHPGSLKKGKTPPVAVTSPITHTAQSALRVTGKPGRGERQGQGLSPWSPGLPELVSWGLSSSPVGGIADPHTWVEETAQRGHVAEPGSHS